MDNDDRINDGYHRYLDLVDKDFFQEQINKMTGEMIDLKNRISRLESEINELKMPKRKRWNLL